MRRNRSRLMLLMFVSVVNALAVYTVLAGGAALIVFLGGPSLADRAWPPALRTGVIVAMTAGVAFLVGVAFGTLQALPATVSGGLGVRPVKQEEERVPEVL